MSNKKSNSKNRHKKTLRNVKTHKQIYKMRGCSRTKKHLGGVNLAYPNNVPTLRNPNLAYVGGTNYNKNAYPSNPNVNSTYKGWLNTQHKSGGGINQTGGDCGCGQNMALQTGGNNGLPYGGNLPPMKGIPYPGGTAGEPLVNGNIHSWPGVSGVSGSGNHYKLNTYNNGFVTNIKNEGAQNPFRGGGKGKRKNKNKNSRKTVGGYSFSNSIAQDFVNVGRQFTHGVGSAYNSFNGYSRPVSPLPWKNQLQGMPNNSALKLLKL